jgi:hypothetical protein
MVGLVFFIYYYLFENCINLTGLLLIDLIYLPLMTIRLDILQLEEI